MRYGCVIQPDQIEAAIAAGFDYIELPARALDPEGDHELALRTIGRALAKSRRPVEVEVFSGLLPADLPLVGPAVDEARLRRYLHRAFTDMWALGGLLVVLASAPSRHIPAGFPRAQAAAQFAHALALIAEEADRNGLDLALAPVQHPETSLLSTLDECRRFLADQRLERVWLLADSAHLAAAGEPLAVVRDCGALIAHVHVADRQRQPPGRGDLDLGPFFAALRTIGYDRRIAIACTWRDFGAEAAPALAYVRQQWEMSAGAAGGRAPAGS